MVIDTSAIVAILLNEPEAGRFTQALEQATVRQMSPVSRVELSMVIEGRNGEPGRVDLERLLAWAEIDIIPVSSRHADIAVAAFRRYGKGRHRAALNIGDCFSYALASATGLPLLFKGADFAATDIVAAV